MSTQDLPLSADETPNVLLERPEHRTVASYERELNDTGRRKSGCETLSPEKKLCSGKRTS